MAKKLTDLTTRTATADSDLIHVNSGGMDYKEEKINFLNGDFSHAFNNTTLLTTQADALPNKPGVYHGYCAASGHQTELGIPINVAIYVTVKFWLSTYAEIEIQSVTNPEGDHYILKKVSGAWDSTWTKVPTRAEITSLNSSLTNSSISINAGSSAVTITRNNSYKWGNLIVVAVRFQVTSALAIYDYVLQIPSTYRIVSDVYAPLMSGYFTIMADKGLYVDAGSYTIRASASIPSGNYTAYIPVLVRNA